LIFSSGITMVMPDFFVCGGILLADLPGVRRRQIEDGVLWIYLPKKRVVM